MHLSCIGGGIICLVYRFSSGMLAPVCAIKKQLSGSGYVLAPNAFS
jgi:hypothetical protein